MNSDETWLLYMWSGVFASAVGGAVAVLVLWRTNRLQSQLAEKAREEARRDAVRLLNQQQSLAQGQIQAQRAAQEKLMLEQRQLSAVETIAAEKRAASALRSQKKSLKRQFKQQQQGIDRQLAEQRHQVKLDKRINALSDLAGCLSELVDFEHLDALTASSTLLRANSIVIRWRVNGGPVKIADQFEEMLDTVSQFMPLLISDDMPDIGKKEAAGQLEASMKGLREILYIMAEWDDQDSDVERKIVFDSETGKLRSSDWS